MTNELKPPPTTTSKTKNDLVTFNDLLPQIDGARQSKDPIRQAALRELASMAAAALGRMPKRQPKTWTGWIGDQHCWRGRRVVLGNGVVAEIYGIQGGQAAVRWPDPHWIEGVRYDVVPVDELTIFKHPAAIVLGKLNRGCKEQPSERNHARCQLNGARPVRPGHRPRGRPLKRKTAESA